MFVQYEAHPWMTPENDRKVTVVGYKANGSTVKLLTVHAQEPKLNPHGLSEAQQDALAENIISVLALGVVVASVLNERETPDGLSAESMET